MKTSRRLWLYSGACLVAAFLVLLGANHQATAWIQSRKFADLLDKETSKGLKLEGHYYGIKRVGMLGLAGDSFIGIKGQKTIVEMDAHEITGWFNPLGFFLQRWQLDDLHVKWGTVMLQTSQPSGQKSPGKPWWGWFWPYRVHLEDVKVDDACALWQLKGKTSGIYHAFLELTPNGHDFEYDARGGEFKTPFTPALQLQHLHLLVRKPRLYCEEFRLGDDPAHPEDQIAIHGDAGLQQDRSMHLAVDIKSMKVSPWLPETWRGHVLGQANGHFEYASTSSGLETGDGHGHLGVVNGVLHELEPVRRYIAVTGSPDRGDMALTVCEADLTWKQGALSVENLKVQCDDMFRLEGTIQMAKDGTLSGTLQLGLTDPYLKWLPKWQDIFSRDDGAYHFTAIQISGTSKKPGQDLSARVLKQIEKSPGTGLKLFFNQVGDWFSFP